MHSHITNSLIDCQLVMLILELNKWQLLSKFVVVFQEFYGTSHRTLTILMIGEFKSSYYYQF